MYQLCIFYHEPKKINLDLYKRVVHFFNMADTDGDRKISLVEFFIQLPKLEEFLLNKKLELQKQKK